MLSINKYIKIISKNKNMYKLLYKIKQMVNKKQLG